MWAVLVNGWETNPLKLYRKHGANDKLWPEARCDYSKCRKIIFLHGKLGLRLKALGIKIPDNVSRPSFNHFPGQGNGCPNASQERKNEHASLEEGLTPEEAELFRTICLTGENFERTKGVLFSVLGSYNYSQELLDNLIGLANRDGIWRARFPIWFTPYMLIDNRVIYNFRLKGGGERDVRFVSFGPKGDRTLRLVKDKTGKSVGGYDLFPVAQEIFDSGSALISYEKANVIAPDLVRGRPQQITMFGEKPLAGLSLPVLPRFKPSLQELRGSHL
jgi:hypothetical protein